jgi:hypothetical protein
MTRYGRDAPNFSSEKGLDFADIRDGALNYFDAREPKVDDANGKGHQSHRTKLPNASHVVLYLFS